jgi:hypothetical protein
MKKSFVIVACVLALGVSSLAAPQTGDKPASSASQEAAREQRAKEEQARQAQAKEVAAKVEQAQANRAKIEEGLQASRFVRTLTNVQIELTLTDQIGSETPEKKTVSMIVSSGNWGKIRSAGSVVMVPGDGPYVVDLNVDARPLVSVEGPIQLDLTLSYAPPRAAADAKQPKPRPTGLNQSLTVVLQSGKPLVVSQAADPISDRKVIVEVKATVLK